MEDQLAGELRQHESAVYGMLAAQGPLALLPALGTGLVGWLAAAYRQRRLDDPIYPIELSAK